jgi:hypothetical protein
LLLFAFHYFLDPDDHVILLAMIGSKGTDPDSGLLADFSSHSSLSLVNRVVQMDRSKDLQSQLTFRMICLNQSTNFLVPQVILEGEVCLQF